MTKGSRIVLFLAVLAGVFGLTNAAAAEPAASGYVAVIDAGSSGSRLTLYADDPESLVPIIVTGVDRATKGLSSFAETPALAGPGAITPLLEELGSYLADQGIQRADVPVALLATAGLRNVRADDRAAAQAILASGRTAIAESGYRVADARILPAVQEATLAWLDANALRDTVESKRRSVGIIEIGGASAQVAFRSPTAEGRAVQIVRVVDAGRKRCRFILLPEQCFWSRTHHLSPCCRSSSRGGHRSIQLEAVCAGLRTDHLGSWRCSDGRCSRRTFWHPATLRLHHNELPGHRQDSVGVRRLEDHRCSGEAHSTASSGSWCLRWHQRVAESHRVVRGTIHSFRGHLVSVRSKPVRVLVRTRGPCC